jgi:predicted MPP superfamily phosphohydrolase
MALRFAEFPEAFQEYRIALISDIHVGAGFGRDHVEQIVEKTNAAAPDLVVIAGDLVDGTVDQLGDDLAPLADLEAPDGVLVTTGNHEFYSGAGPWVEFWENDLGLNVLDNEAVVISREGSAGTEYLGILGVNDRSGRPPLAADIQAAWDDLIEQNPLAAADDRSATQILIAHQPLQALTDDGLPGRLGIDAQLSGHTHGGQLWPIRYLVRLQQPVVDGIHEVGGIQVLTSRGAGGWGPPVRVGASPQIPVVALCSTSLSVPSDSPCW